MRVLQALRFVLDTVRKASDTKMYFFGITALDRFKARLKDYPQYCQHVSCLPHFKEFPAHLVDWIECGARSQTPHNKPEGPLLTIQQVSSYSESSHTRAKKIGQNRLCLY